MQPLVVTLSIALHGAVLGAASWLSDDPAPSGTPAASPPAITLVAARQVPATTGQSPPPPAPKAAAAPSPAAAARPDAATAPQRHTSRYFEIDEVDEPAVPQPDWQIDPETLNGFGIRSLRAEVQVSDRGIATRCRVAIEPAMPQAEAAIGRQLCTTRLRPAMRRGVAVASVRRIELLLAQ